MQKIVIFDMDGTLIDSKKDITISINYVRQINHKLPPLSEDFVVDAINMYERNLPYLFYKTESYEQRDRELFEKHYKEQCIEHSYLYDDVEEMLHVLKENGVKMAIATNAPTLFARTMLEHLRVADLFDEIMGADRVKISKPHPEMIKAILDIYNYDENNDRAWMVGDNSKDMESGENAGIETIFVTWGFSANGNYKSIVKEPKEILNIIL